MHGVLYLDKGGKWGPFGKPQKAHCIMGKGGERRRSTSAIHMESKARPLLPLLRARSGVQYDVPRPVQKEKARRNEHLHRIKQARSGNAAACDALAGFSWPEASRYDPGNRCQ